MHPVGIMRLVERVRVYLYVSVHLSVALLKDETKGHSTLLKKKSKHNLGILKESRNITGTPSLENKFDRLVTQSLLYIVKVHHLV